MKQCAVAVFLLAVLAACAPTGTLSDDDPSVDTERDGVDLDDGSVSPPRYWRWPRRSDVEPDERFPDSSEFADANDRPPIFSGEEFEFPDEELILIASHNLRGHGERKASQAVFPVGNPADVPERTLGAFLGELHRGLDADVLVLQEVVGGKAKLELEFADIGRDGRVNLDGNGEIRYDSRKVSTAAVMLQLQTLLGPEMALVRGTEEYTRAIGSRRNRYYEYCPIFYDTETLSCWRGGVSRRSGFGGNRRGVSMARCQLRDVDDQVPDETEFDFAIACVHAPPPRADRKDKRKYQAALVRMSRWLARNRDPDVIIAGDFNLDYRQSSSSGLIEYVTESLRRYEEDLREDAEDDNALDGLAARQKRKSTATSYENGIDENGNQVGTNISESNPKVYDDIVWFAETYEDATGTKMIESAFDNAFKRPNGQVDRTQQHRYSDHKPVWALFYAHRDKGDEARSDN